MITTRRRVLQGTLGLAAASTFYIPRFAGAAEFNYKYANNLPPTHPMNVRAKEAVERIREETDGRVAIEIFPAAQLGTDSDLLSQLRAGGVEFFTMAGALLSSLVPVATIEAMAYAFPDYPTVWKAMDGDLGALIRGEISKYGIVAMDKVWDNGFHQITTRDTPINTPADLQGLKIRTGASALQVSMCQAFGASPVSLSFGELYTALQTGIVDAQLNALILLQTAKLHEVQKHCAITNHMWSGFWFLANKNAWEAIPEDLREIVARHINEAGVNERADIEQMNVTLMEELTGEGVQFTQPESQPFREVLAEKGFYAEWKGKLGEEAWAALEASAGKLG
jgi:tripartite ATP-independent transporter DctP family solute receptor